MATPEEIYARGRTVDNTPLSVSEEVFYAWYLKHDQEDRVRAKAMEDMDSFSEVFSQEEIQRDKQWVEKMRQSSQQKDHTHRAEIAEHIIKTFANDSEWFGEDAAITETVEYDDRKNHADFIVEWDNETGDGIECALAIDCTVSDYREIINKKIGYITKDIVNGKLTDIKYHDSNLTGEKTSLKNVPRVLLTINKETLPKLCEKLVVHTKNSSVYDQEKENYMQLYTLKIIKAQLDNQISYIESLSLNAATDRSLQETQKVLIKISETLEKKEKSLPDSAIKQASEEYSLADRKISAALI